MLRDVLSIVCASETFSGSREIHPPFAILTCCTTVSLVNDGAAKISTVLFFDFPGKRLLPTDTPTREMRKVYLTHFSLVKIYYPFSLRYMVTQATKRS